MVPTLLVVYHECVHTAQPQVLKIHKSKLELKDCGDTVMLHSRDSIQVLHASCPDLPDSDLERSAPAQLHSLRNACPGTACWIARAGSPSTAAG